MDLNPRYIAALIKEAKRRAIQEKKAASNNVRAELVADNLIAYNIFPAEQRDMIVESLKDHNKTLLLMDKVAQAVAPANLGTPVRPARTGVGYHEPDLTRESDRAFVQAALSLR